MAGAVNSNQQTEGHNYQTKEQGTEFWSPFSGFSLKITDTLLVVFTVLLFVATVGLWYATRHLVIGADKTAERQLRTYVFTSLADGEKLFLGDSDCLSAPLIIKNYGQTPAYKLKCSAFIGLYKLPLSEILSPPDYANGSLGCLAPNQIVRQYPPLPLKLNQSEMNAIKSGECGIYIWGYLEYVDIFRIQRKARFRMISTGADFDRGELAYCEDGNEAD